MLALGYGCDHAPGTPISFMKQLRNIAFTLSMFLSAGQGICADSNPAGKGEGRGEGRLRFDNSVTRDDLAGLNSVTISADGQFLYATPWPGGAIVVFQRDAAQGGLKHVQTLKNQALAGDTGFEVNAAGDRAIAACFQARSAVLMRRDKKTGKLEILDSAREGQGEVTGLAFAIDALFSPDGKFVYVLDGEGGGIATFAIRNDKLVFLNATRGEDDCLAGSRGASLDPKGTTMYVTSHQAGTLTVLKRAPESGLLKVQQVVTDEDENVHGLAGAFGVVCSRDGRFIYTTSGRFQGDSAVSVFQAKSDGKVEPLQEFMGEELESFLGGNRLALSPDEKNLYVVASRSGSLACFARDAKTGKLKLLETLIDGEEKGILAGAAGVAVSPDGKYVYVAAEGQSTISIYRRD